MERWNEREQEREGERGREREREGGRVEKARQSNDSLEGENGR
jgi:hypothetical protein